MSEFKVVDGKIVELVEQEVVEDQIETDLQEELDQAQNDLNALVENLSSVEQQYLDAEALAEAASTALDEAKVNKDAAEARVSKSILRRDNWAQAVALRQEQLESSASEDDDPSAEGTAEGDTTDITDRISLAEG